MIKSPLRYPGGKSRAIKHISPLIPEFDEYREPFVGGGSVFVYLKQRYPNKKFWINDIYKNLYHFWANCQSQTDELILQINYWKAEYKNGKELHRYLRENIDSFNDLKKAAAFFIFNRITFSGTTESGGFSNGAFEKRFTESSIKRAKLLSTILPQTNITNYDYQKVVEAEGEDVFIYLDPPYYSARKSALYGKNGKLHTGFDHYRFAETMKKTKHKWLITYDDSSFIRDLFSFAYIVEWNLKYGMRNVTKYGDQNGKELFIANYDIVPNTKEKQLMLMERQKKYTAFLRENQ